MHLRKLPRTPAEGMPSTHASTPRPVNVRRWQVVPGDQADLIPPCPVRALGNSVAQHTGEARSAPSKMGPESHGGEPAETAHQRYVDRQDQEAEGNHPE